MLTKPFRRYAPSVTILLILVGFTLVMIGNDPVRAVGAAMLFLSVIVPWLSLGIKPDPPGWNRDADRARGAAEQASAAPTDAEASNAERGP